MKRIFFILSFLVCGIVSAQQYFFNGTVYVPKTTAQINAISSPQEGRQEYNSTTGTMWVYNGSSWFDTGTGGSGSFLIPVTQAEYDLLSPTEIAENDYAIVDEDDGSGSGGGASQLSDLSDVGSSTPTNRNVLIADGADWESRPLVEADISDLGNYVDISTNQTIDGIKSFLKTPRILGDTVEVTERNRHINVLSVGGQPIARLQTERWNGSSFVSTTGFGFGDQALENNTGSSSNGFGYLALRHNTGASSNGFGYFALRDNTGATSNGFGYQALENNTGTSSNGFGYSTLQNNTGSFSNGFGTSVLGNNTGTSSNGFGYFVLQNNTGDNSNGFGYQALRYNTGSNVTGLGTSSLQYNEGNNIISLGSYKDVFDPDTWNAKTVANNATDINVADDEITLTAHGFTTSNSFILLRYTTDGAAIGGMSNNSVYQFEIVDANTIKPRLQNIASTGGTATHTFTPQPAPFNNVAVIGNTAPTRSQQTAIQGLSAIMPDATISEIDATGAKALITKEYGDTNYGKSSDSGTTGLVLKGLTSGTYTTSAQSWNWSRSGDIVHFRINLSSVDGTTPTGTFLVDLSATSFPEMDVNSFYHVATTNFPLNFYSIFGSVHSVSAISISIQDANDGSNTTPVSDVDFSGNTTITISGTYITND